MRKISGYFISLLLCSCLGVAPCLAQQADSVKQKKYYAGGFSPSALRIGVSLNNIIQTFADAQGNYLGFQADLPIRQFMLSFDYGRAAVQLANQQDVLLNRNFAYSSQGSFFRFGIDANLLKDKEKNNNDAYGDVIFFGLKYAHSRIDDALTFTVEDTLYTSATLSQNNNNLGAWWLEMNAGVKIQIVKNIFLGYTLRYKFFRRLAGGSSLIPYEVPGFGRGIRKNGFGFDYYIYYRIPFR